MWHVRSYLSINISEWTAIFGLIALVAFHVSLWFIFHAKKKKNEKKNVELNRELSLHKIRKQVFGRDIAPIIDTITIHSVRVSPAIICRFYADIKYTQISIATFDYSELRLYQNRSRTENNRKPTTNFIKRSKRKIKQKFYRCRLPDTNWFNHSTKRLKNHTLFFHCLFISTNVKHWIIDIYVGQTHIGQIS